MTKHHPQHHRASDAQLLAAMSAGLPSRPASITWPSAAANPFNALRSLYNEHAVALIVIRAALASLLQGTATAPLRWACVGDSVTAGFSPPAAPGRATTSYPAQLIKLLDAAGYPVSDGPAVLNDTTTPDARWTGFGGTWTWTTTGNGLYYKSSTNGATAIYKSNRGGPYLQLCYFDGAAAGIFSISIDGATPTSGQVTMPSGGATFSAGVVTPGNTGTWKTITVSGLTAARHTLTITAGSANAVIPLWADVLPALACLQVGNFGCSGTAASVGNPRWDATADNHSLLNQVLLGFAPTFATVNLGINDFENGDGSGGPVTTTQIAAFKTSMTTILSALVSAGCSPMIVAPHPIVGVTTSITSTERGIYYGLADTLALPLADINDLMVNAADAIALGLLGNDTEISAGVYVHLTPAGYMLEALALAAVILPATPAASSDINYTQVTSFAHSWVDAGGAGGISNVGYRKIRGDLVKLRGLIRSGTASQVAFTLPVGYRPPSIQSFVCATSTGTTVVVLVGQDGTITPLASAQLDLSGILLDLKD